MNRGGYVKIYRKTLKSDTYQALTASQRDVFWVCLLLASYEPKQWEWNGEIFTCEPGQFITSLASIKKICAKDTSTKNIRTALHKLEKWGFLANKATKSGRLITIINWDSYQGQKGETGKETGKEAAKKRQLSRRSKKVKEDIYMPEFELFWAEYPRKVGKKKAVEAWKKFNGNLPPVDELIRAVRAQAKTKQWQDDNGKYIPYPATWINNQRWEDEIEMEGTDDPDVDAPPYWREVN